MTDEQFISDDYLCVKCAVPVKHGKCKLNLTEDKSISYICPLCNSDQLVLLEKFFNKKKTREAVKNFEVKF